MAVIVGKLNRFLYGRKASTQPLVDGGGKSFDIDIHCVNIRQEQPQNLRFCRAIAHKDDCQRTAFGKYGTVEDVFVIDQRFVVGKGNADIAVLFFEVERNGYKLIRRKLPAGHIIGL